MTALASRAKCQWRVRGFESNYAARFHQLPSEIVAQRPAGSAAAASETSTAGTGVYAPPAAAGWSSPEKWTPR